MFTILRKNVDGRYYDRFFLKWENAKHDLLKDVEEFVNHGWEITYKINKMNTSKGFHEFQYELKKGESQVIFSLLDGYFCD